MATLEAVAMKRGEAVKRIEVVQARLKAALDVDPVELPTQGRDPMLVVANQFAGLADYLEALADAVESQQRDAEPDAVESQQRDAEPAEEESDDKPARKRKAK